MNNYYVHCYDCGKNIAGSEEGLQYLIRLFGDYYECSCGNKIKLRLTKEDYRKFKLKKIKDKIER